MKTMYLRNIKKGFATNSSSYHSTLIITESEYEKWMNGEITIQNSYDEDITYDEWGENYECEVTRYTSPSGDKIVILCEHGSDY